VLLRREEKARHLQVRSPFERKSFRTEVEIDHFKGTNRSEQRPNITFYRKQLRKQPHDVHLKGIVFNGQIRRSLEKQFKI
jgi:hypothetical protein